MCTECDGAILSKFGCIAEQVKERLSDFCEIACHRPKPGLDIQHQLIAIFRKQGLYGCCDIFDKRFDIKRLKINRHFPRLNLGQIQDVINEREEVFTSALNFVEVWDELGDTGVFGFFRQHFAVSDDGVHGGAELMAHVREEGALGAIGSFCIIPCSHRFDAGRLGCPLGFVCKRGGFQGRILVAFRSKKRI